MAQRLAELEPGSPQVGQLVRELAGGGLSRRDNSPVIWRRSNAVQRRELLMSFHAGLALLAAAGAVLARRCPRWRRCRAGRPPPS